MTQVIAKSKYIRQTPRKIRLVADQVRGLPVEEAEVILKNLNKRAARPLLLTLKQGVGNAVNNFQLEKNSLKIKIIEIGEGPRFKRMDKSHRFFRWGTIQKKTAHVRMILTGKKERAEKKTVDRKEKQAKEKKGLIFKKKNPKSKIQKKGGSSGTKS